MGLFKKSEKKEEKKGEVKESIPSLPELPKLPELPAFSLSEETSQGKLSPLPGFPSNSFGNKFSQYSIKEAVTGEKEDEDDEADDSEQDDVQMMQRPLTEKTVREEIRPYSSNSFSETKIKEIEPLFIRIDKFEEGSQTFDEVKKQVVSIEKLFGDLKKVKDDEEKEMKFFEDEIKDIKGKIDNIDKNIFSKLG